MINPKFVCISAVAGFVLSFFIGIISSAGFLHSLVRALIVAVVFAVISVVIYFLYTKFLSPADDGDSQKNSDEDVSSAKTLKTGGVVDITVGDEKLPDDDQGPQFYVSNNLSSLGGEELKKDQKEINKNSQKENDEYRIDDDFDTTKKQGKNFPVNNGNDTVAPRPDEGIESLDSDGAVEADDKSFIPIDLAKQSTKANKSSAVHIQDNMDDDKNISQEEIEKTEDLDELPDIEDLSPDNTKDSNDDIISDSDFASNGDTKSKGATFKDGKTGKEQDTKIMAQAIRTLLTKDNGN